MVLYSHVLHSVNSASCGTWSADCDTLPPCREELSQAEHFFNDMIMQVGALTELADYTAQVLIYHGVTELATTTRCGGQPITV